MSAQRAPKSPIADPKTGQIAGEWLSWLQTIADAADAASSGGGGGGGGGGSGGGGDGSGDGTDIGSGTPGVIAKWVENKKLGDSLISESGTTVTINGALITASGSVGGGGGSADVPYTPIYFLGGTPTTYVQSPIPDWVPADGSPIGQSGTEYVIDSVTRKVLTGTVRVRLRAAAGGVSARLYDLDATASVGNSLIVTGTQFATVSFPVTLSGGQHRYQLQLLPTLANTDVNGIGYLQ